jgi:ubiquinone/menaquinone biosynthesis C-methylase UbiE
MTDPIAYACPAAHAPLALSADGAALVSPEGRRYRVAGGIANFLDEAALTEIEAATKVEYDRVADGIYDVAVDWQFAAFHEDESAVRERMLDLFGIQPGWRVLEVGCGTGRDSFRIAERVGRSGALHLQDLSPGMVAACHHFMETHPRRAAYPQDMAYFVSNASTLPYADGAFDAVFHFGGYNQFGDQKAAAAEFARVTRPGGRILIGDEAVAPWLKGTAFDKIVCTNNALFAAPAPLETLPDCAREVTIQWIIANCFYVLAFTRGEGPPPLNLDLPHKGWRGGTMRSRYFGVLEGISPEAKALVKDAAAASGLSVHDWLDALVRREANSALDAAKTKS